MAWIFSIIGLGKLGCSMAVAVASRGFNVIGVDISKNTVEQLNEGFAPVQETNLQAMIENNKDKLHGTLSHREAILNSDVSFVIVPTPSDDNGAFSLQYAKWAFREIGRALADKKTYHLIVLTSTVLPGSTRYGLLPVLECESGKKCGKDFGLCYSPGFIALGSIIHDFLNPDFTLVGEFDKESGQLLEQCYSKVMQNNPPCKRMTIENAELTKIALNTFITTKITYANMLAELCENIPGGNVDTVTDAIGTDSRVGRKYLIGALGYGGPCFPRDNLALSFMAKELGSQADLAEATHKSNKSIMENIVRRLLKLIQRDETIAVLGLAYKPHSHVVEESQGVYLAKAFNKAGCRVIAYDPLANNMARNELKDQTVILDSLTDCLEQAQVFMITTPDPEFKKLKIEDFNNNITIIDFWRTLNKEFSESSNIRYIPIGQCINDIEKAEGLKKIWSRTEQMKVY